MRYLKTYEVDDSSLSKEDKWLNASSENNIDIIKKYIEEGIDIDLQYTSGMNALMFATCWNNYNIVKLLLKNGTNVNIQDILGRTALFHAVERKNTRISKLLLDKNTDISIKNDSGINVLGANERDFWYNEELQELIIKHQPHNFHLLSKNNIEIHPNIKNKYPEIIDTIDLGLL